MVPLDGVKVKGSGEHTEVLALLKTGLGLTVTVTVNVAPTHVPVVGVIV